MYILRQSNDILCSNLISRNAELPKWAATFIILGSIALTKATTDRRAAIQHPVDISVMIKRLS
jgi:hypothetical protein